MYIFIYNYNASLWSGNRQSIIKLFCTPEKSEIFSE